MIANDIVRWVFFFFLKMFLWFGIDGFHLLNFILRKKIDFDWHKAQSIENDAHKQKVCKQATIVR